MVVIVFERHYEWILFATFICAWLLRSNSGNFSSCSTSKAVTFAVTIYAWNCTVCWWTDWKGGGFQMYMLCSVLKSVNTNLNDEMFVLVMLNCMSYVCQSQYKKSLVSSCLWKISFCYLHNLYSLVSNGDSKLRIQRYIIQ